MPQRKPSNLAKMGQIRVDTSAVPMENGRAVAGPRVFPVLCLAFWTFVFLPVKREQSWFTFCCYLSYKDHEHSWETVNESKIALMQLLALLQQQRVVPFPAFASGVFCLYLFSICFDLRGHICGLQWNPLKAGAARGGRRSPAVPDSAWTAGARGRRAAQAGGGGGPGTRGAVRAPPPRRARGTAQAARRPRGASLGTRAPRVRLSRRPGTLWKGVHPFRPLGKTSEGFALF